MQRIARMVKVLGLALILLTASQSFSFADEAGQGEYLALDTGHYDLVRAHNQRMIVLFGNSVSFKRYEVLDILNRYVPVASTVRGGVRYSLHEAPGVKTLVID